jgi:hypothetical protein
VIDLPRRRTIGPVVRACSTGGLESWRWSENLTDMRRNPAPPFGQPRDDYVSSGKVFRSLQRALTCHNLGYGGRSRFPRDTVKAVKVIAGLACIGSGEGHRALANIGEALEPGLDQGELRHGESHWVV